MVTYHFMTKRNGNKNEPASGVGIGQGDESEFGGAVQNQVLCEAAHVQHNHAGGEEELDDEIPVSNLPIDQDS